MEINMVETFPMLYKLKNPYGDANGYKKYRTCFLFKIMTKDGVEGWGECVDWLPTLEKGFRERVIPFLVGKQANERTKIVQQVAQWNQRMATGVSMALTDIMATYSGLSICDLWGGGLRNTVPVYASFQSYSDQEDWIKHSIQLVEDSISNGYQSGKVKIGGRSLKEDLQHIELLFNAVGEKVSMAIDVNQSYDLSTTRVLINRMNNYPNLMWIEEPMPLDQTVDYQMLRLHSSVPIAGGENLQGSIKFLPLLREAGIDIMQPDVMHHSSVDEYRHSLHLARTSGLRASPHSFDGMLSRIYALLAQACLPSWSKMNQDDIEPVEWDVMENPFTHLFSISPRNGVVSIPSGTGLGLEIDTELIQHYRWDGKLYS